MDLNDLFHRQQVERFRSESAASVQASKAHARLAARYEHSIERLTDGRIRFGSRTKPHEPLPSEGRC